MEPSNPSPRHDKLFMLFKKDSPALSELIWSVMPKTVTSHKFSMMLWADGKELHRWSPEHCFISRYDGTWYFQKPSTMTRGIEKSWVTIPTDNEYLGSVHSLFDDWKKYWISWKSSQYSSFGRIPSEFGIEAKSQVLPKDYGGTYDQYYYVESQLTQDVYELGRKKVIETREQRIRKDFDDAVSCGSIIKLPDGVELIESKTIPTQCYTIDTWVPEYMVMNGNYHVGNVDLFIVFTPKIKHTIIYKDVFYNWCVDDAKSVPLIIEFKPDIGGIFDSIGDVLRQIQKYRQFVVHKHTFLVVPDSVTRDYDDIFRDSNIILWRV